MRKQTVGLLARTTAAATAAGTTCTATASASHSLLQQGSGIASFHAGSTWGASSPHVPASLLGGAGSQDSKEKDSFGSSSINVNHPLLRLPVAERSAGPFARPWGATAGVTWDAPKYGRPRPYGNTIDTWAGFRSSYDSTTTKKGDFAPALYLFIGTAAFGMWFQDLYAYPPRTIGMFVMMAMLLYVRRDGFIPTRAARGLPPKDEEDPDRPPGHPQGHPTASASDYFKM